MGGICPYYISLRNEHLYLVIGLMDRSWNAEQLDNDSWCGGTRSDSLGGETNLCRHLFIGNIYRHVVNVYGSELWSRGE
jgi:hypothetical protein